MKNAGRITVSVKTRDDEVAPGGERRPNYYARRETRWIMSVQEKGRGTPNVYGAAPILLTARKLRELRAPGCDAARLALRDAKIALTMARNALTDAMVLLDKANQKNRDERRAAVAAARPAVARLERQVAALLDAFLAVQMGL